MTAGDLVDVVILAAGIVYSSGGQGGLAGNGAVSAPGGANGASALAITGNIVSLGGGDDRLNIFIDAIESTGITFSNNQFDGGAGYDTLTLSARFTGEAVSIIEFDLGAGFSGFEQVLGGIGGDRIIAADAGATIDGGNGDDVLTGRAGADRFFGGSGDDLLDGSAGDDVLQGGLGNDALTGGDGNDRASYAGAEAVVVSLARTTAQDTLGGGIDTLAEIENLTGSDGDDRLAGNGVANLLDGGLGHDALAGRGGNDTLVGGSGNDTLDGGLGDDTMAGGLGNDLYFVGSAGDTVTELSGPGTDRVTATIDYVLGADVENLVLRGAAQFGTGNALDNAMLGSSGKNTLAGLAGADAIDGGTGFDTLDGGAGDDVLTGGIGKDRLTGGAGLDQFVFRDGDLSPDRSLTDMVTDFSHGQGDRLKLSPMDANTVLAGDQKFAFLGAGAFTGVAGQLHYVQDAGNTFVEGDTNGDGVADFSIRLVGLVNLVGADFVL